MQRNSKLVNKFFTNFRRLKLFASRNIFPLPNLEVASGASYEIISNGVPRSKILYIALKYDYGNELRGLAYEEYNFFHALKNMRDLKIIRFDFYTYCFRYGSDFASKMVKEIAIIENVDKIIFLLYLDLLDHEVLNDLSTNHSIESILWLFDDDKRYLDTIDVVHQCTKVVTTMKSKHEIRKNNNINSYLAQFATNHYLYRDFGMARTIDVTFIGQNFGNREEYINYLRINGVTVAVYGDGWSSGRLCQSQMLEQFNKSKIVLNFSSSDGRPDLKHLKGRVFEVPPTGALLLTELCENLEDYFDIPCEIDVFQNKAELLEKVKFYLQNEDVRARVAAAAQKKVLEKYTIEGYLERILFD